MSPTFFWEKFCNKKSSFGGGGAVNNNHVVFLLCLEKFDLVGFELSFFFFLFLLSKEKKNKTFASTKTASKTPSHFLTGR